MPDVMLITGTSKGIGRGLVDEYLARGFKVAGCSRSAFDGELPDYLHYQLDVADEHAVVEMVRDVVQKWGRIDVLVNNAGIASMNHTILTPLHTVESIFSTNVFGTFLFAREVAKSMIRNRYGRIINFATVATPLKLEGEAVYAASKSAVKTYTEILAKELAPFGITVNAVGPTPVPTDLVAGVPKEKMDALIASQPIQRFGTIADIINVIDFFVARRSEFITAQTIYLGGVS